MITLGIYVYTDPRGLARTLESIERHAPDAAVVLLPDGPDRAMADHLTKLSKYPQLASRTPTGSPAAFNRLIKHGDAALVAFLESGASLSTGALTRLSNALSETADAGLAGPSTNLTWNQQRVREAPGFDAIPAAVDAFAVGLADRWGEVAEGTGPLHAVADVCFAITREAITRVGGADESYGGGPCWEIDLAVRAARAGLRSLWVRAAYVHRAPHTARRLADEKRFFSQNKKLFQDRFCGRRLRGETSGYRSHCMGEECPNFAPPALIKLRCPSEPAAPAAASDRTVRRAPAAAPARNISQASRSIAVTKAESSATQSPERDELVARPEPRTAFALSEQNRSSPAVSLGDAPLVSCIMPTYNRRRWVPLAIGGFQRQDYPNLELIVIDDGTDPVVDLVLPDPRVRYLRLPRKLTVGAKRNIACDEARGQFIAHWDDDDWYQPWRVSRQVDELLASGAEVCGASRLLFYKPASDEAYRYEYVSASWVHGSTLVYRRCFWERTKFPEVQIGEDVRFVAQLRGKGLQNLRDVDLCVCMIHKGNTSPKQVRSSLWKTAPKSEVQALMGDEVAAYREAARPALPECAAPGRRVQAGRATAPRAARISAVPSRAAQEYGEAAESGPEAQPVISCIMPTRNRRPFIELALAGFHRQDYPRRELIIIDDGTDPVEDIVKGCDRVRYIRVTKPMSIGAKRNLACKEASGQLIAHWDDDDWYAPNRLTYQASSILRGEAHVTGLEMGALLELSDGRFWSMHPELHRRMFVGDVHGGTLTYFKSLFDGGVRYPDSSLAEDAVLLLELKRRGKRLMRMANPGVFVYMRHGRNAWRIRAGGQGWTSAEAPPTFPDDSLLAYQAAAQALCGGGTGPTVPLKGERKVRSLVLPARLAQQPNGSVHAVKPSWEPLDGDQVTVSMAYYKCKPYLRRAVECVLAQTHEDLRLVVTNDADPDEPWDVLEDIKDRRLVRFSLPGNHGPYFVHDVVLRACRTPYFAVHDADDQSGVAWLKTLLQSVRAKEGAVAAVPGHRAGGCGTARGPRLDYLYPHHGVFRVDALRAVGGYYGGTRIAYDAFLTNVLAMIGHIVLCDSSLYRLTARTDSLSRSRDTGMGSRVRADVNAHLRATYAQLWGRYLVARGDVPDWARFQEELRGIAAANITPFDQTALAEAAARLSARWPCIPLGASAHEHEQ